MGIKRKKKYKIIQNKKKHIRKRENMNKRRGVGKDMGGEGRDQWGKEWGKKEKRLGQ